MSFSLIPKLNIDYPFSRLIKSIVPWLTSQEYPYRIDNTFFLNHARTGLRIALSALHLPVGSKVGMSMYNCLTVMNAVREAGYQIVFIDITDDFLLDLEDLYNKKSQLSALIVTHFFGIPNDIGEIKAIVQDLPIIEDCAHAYGSMFRDGTFVGSKGDFAVFSIGLGKFPSIGNGGLLLVNGSKYLSSVDEMVSSLPCPRLIEETKMMLASFIKYLAYRPAIYKILLPLKRKKQRTVSFYGMYHHTETVMPRYVHYLYDREMPMIKEQIRKHQDLSQKLYNHLYQITGVKVPNEINGKRNGFLFPIIVDDINAIIKDYFLSQFEITSHFAKSILWAKGFGYQGDCPNAEKITNHNIVLPCHAIIQEIDN